MRLLMDMQRDSRWTEKAGSLVNILRQGAHLSSTSRGSDRTYILGREAREEVHLAKRRDGIDT